MRKTKEAIKRQRVIRQEIRESDLLRKFAKSLGLAVLKAYITGFCLGLVVASVIWLLFG